MEEACLNFHNDLFWDINFFNIFMSELFTFYKKSTLLATEMTIHSLCLNLLLKNVVSSLESGSASLFEWFSNNDMKANPKNCHLLMNMNRPAIIKTGKQTISNSYCEKLFGAKIDSQLNFNNHLETIIKKAGQNTHVFG